MARGIKLKATLQDGVTPKVDKMRGGLKGLGDQTKKTGTKGTNAFRELGRSVGMLPGPLGVVASKLGLVGIAAAGLAYSIGKAVSAAGEFQYAMAEVRTLTNATDRDHKALSSSVRKLAEDYGQLDKTMAKASYNIVSAGFGEINQQLKILDVSSRAAIAGRSDVNTAAGLITQSLNAYGKGADQAARYSDILFATVKGGVTTFGELAQDLGKVTSTAAAMDISFEELTSTIAVMTKKGINTTESATALNSLLVALGAGSGEAKEKLDALGITLDDGLARALAQLDDAGGDAIAVLREMIPNTRALKAAISAGADGARDLAGQLEIAKDSAGMTDDAFYLMSGTLEYAEKRADAAGRRFQTAFGDMFTGTWTGVVNTYTSAISGLSTAVETLSGTGLTATADDLDRVYEIMAKMQGGGQSEFEWGAGAFVGGGQGDFSEYEQAAAEAAAAAAEAAEGTGDALLDLADHWGVMLDAMTVNPETGIMALVPKDRSKLAEEILKAYNEAMDIIAAGPPEIPIVPKVLTAPDEDPILAGPLIEFEPHHVADPAAEASEAWVNAAYDMEWAWNDAWDNMVYKTIDGKLMISNLTKTLYDNMARWAMNSMGQIIGGWIKAGVTEIGLKRATEAAKSQAAAQGAGQRIASQQAETASTNTQTGADAAGAAQKVFTAHAGIPFVGIALSIGFIASMMAAMSSFQSHATGRRVVGPGSGSEDDQLAYLSSGEEVTPAGDVRRRDELAEYARSAMLDEGGGDINISIGGMGDGRSIRQYLEEDVIPELRRLNRQNRLRLT